MHITKEYLRSHPNEIFVFGDNLLRAGMGGAAKLRHEPNTYGFITKKAPNNHNVSFYHPAEYLDVFEREMANLELTVSRNPDKVFLISMLGAGLANRHKIWETVIREPLIDLAQHYPNMRLLFDPKEG